MPAASLARLEKQASLDANDPLKQGIVIIEHKIRNLEKRKTKLDAYRDLQKSGKDLQCEQLEAVAKYDAVIAHLEFAKELSKQLATLATESAKNLKKQARKEAAERAQQELARTKEILIINDLLANMGQTTVRDELLSGKSKVTVTETELQSIDELYEELTPKKEEPVAFVDMFQSPAETMHHLLEGKNKTAFGTTYSALKTKLFEIANSGYFDTLPPPAEEEPEAPVPEPEQTTVPEELPLETADLPTINQVETLVVQQQSQAPMQQPPIVSHSYQPAKGQQPVGQMVNPADVDSSIVRAIPAQPHPNQNQQHVDMAYYTPSHLRVFQSGTIDFMQDNELDTPENTEASASAIPTMTFANQSFNADEPPQMAPIPSAPQHHMDMQHQQHTPQYQPPQTDADEGWSTGGGGGGDSTEVEPQQPTPSQQPMNAWSSIPSEQQPTSRSMNENNDDWADQCDQWSMNQVNSANSNDGFITAGSGRGRGGRGRRGMNDRGGGDRGSRGSYGGNGHRGSNQGGRNSYRGEGGYNRDREGGGGYMRGEGGGNYYKDQNNSGGYQNGYPNNRGRGSNGPPRQPQDRQGGGRGGGGNRGRGGYRGGNSGGGGGSGGNNYRQ